MDAATQVAMFRVLSGAKGMSVEEIELFLLMAGEKILRRRFPFKPQETEVPEEFRALQVRVAVEIYAKQGAEGQTGHNENGISRTYENADVSDSLLSEIIPVGKVQAL